MYLYALQKRGDVRNRRTLGAWDWVYEGERMVTVAGTAEALGHLNTACSADYRWVRVAGEG